MGASNITRVIFWCHRREVCWVKSEQIDWCKSTGVLPRATLTNFHDEADNWLALVLPAICLQAAFSFRSLGSNSNPQLWVGRLSSILWTFWHSGWKTYCYSSHGIIFKSSVVKLNSKYTRVSLLWSPFVLHCRTFSLPDSVYQFKFKSQVKHSTERLYRRGVTL